MKSRATEILARLKEQLAADKKKSAVLGILLVIFVGAIGRLFLSRPQPEMVAAAPAVIPTVPTPQPADLAPQNPRPAKPAPAFNAVDPPQSVFALPGESARHPAPPRPGAPQPPAADDSADRPPAVSGFAFNSRRAVSVESLPRILERDLFTTPLWNKLPPAWSATTKPVVDEDARPRGPGFWSQVLSRLREEAREQAAKRKAIDDELAKLTLQATLTGSSPAAYISGELIRPGQQIAGFELVSVSDRAAVLRRDGTHYTIRMQ